MPLPKSFTTTEEGLALAKQWTSVEKNELIKQGYMERRLAILPGYSTHFINQLLQVSLFKEKTVSQILELEYGTYETAILSKDPRLLKFNPEICYFCVGAEHFHFRDPQEEAARWIRLWKLANEWLGCSIVVNTFEEPLFRLNGAGDFKQPNSQLNLVRDVNSILRKTVPSYVHFHDVCSLANFYGIKNWHDEKMYDLYKLPCAFQYLSTYSQYLSTVCARIYSAAKKCIVLDLDDTLWGGVVGDEGVAAIQIGEGSPVGEAYLRFQTHLKELKDRGILLAVCSKNENTTAREPFLRREEMVLKLEDFSCFLANWDPKPKNIRKIAKSLNLSLESIVFIDDNPAERKLVETELPMVSVLHLPENPSYFARSLSEANYFETNLISDEDLSKTEMYRAEAERTEAISQFSNYENYLENLEMMAQVNPFDEVHLPRITQLINKTNQFNVTTKRYSESEVSKLLSHGSWITRYVKLADRFGDHGLISVFIGKIEGKELVVDSWLMSCRVFKREVETLLFREITKACLKKELKGIRAYFIPTEKNGVIKDLFSNLGFDCIKFHADGKSEWYFPFEKKGVEEMWISRKVPILLLER